MTLLAHSARPKQAIRAQPYPEHIDNVVRRAVGHADAVASYAVDGPLIQRAVRLAAEFHDLGKLDDENQTVLRGVKRRHLALNHVDAGVAHLLRTPPELARQLAAILVFSHHQGLPNVSEHRTRGTGEPFRDLEPSESHPRVKDRTDALLPQYLRSHRSTMPRDDARESEPSSQIQSRLSLLLRMALSCLVDADHFDTSRHYGQAIAAEPPTLTPAKRLARLNDYVTRLAANQVDDRTRLRRDLYLACRDADIRNGSLVACDSPVGSGKTAAIMAHLLRVSAAMKLRRVFVVLPYTNIIDQSLGVYRESLVERGESPEQVVAAHHHRAEFESVEARHLTYLWESPIVVTTAVQFFETLAARGTAALRKLHQLPGSAVFVDEAHAALPAHLWPVAWQWVDELTKHWGCHFVLASGSLSRFWELMDFVDPPQKLPDLVKLHVRSESVEREAKRVAYRTCGEPLDLESLTVWLNDLPGPRLLVVNTVQSAAAIARHLAERFGGERVEHLSTALTPRDRKTTLELVKLRLRQPNHRDWTLVATSCVEAGVDISFRTGIRERAGLVNLLQLAGRVNREKEYPSAEVWDIQLRHDRLLRPHPAFDDAGVVLGELFDQNLINISACTEALRREIRRGPVRKAKEELLKADRTQDFPRVAESFRVIDAPAITAVVDEHLQKAIESHQRISRHELQNGSVQIYSSRATEWGVHEFTQLNGLYAWTLPYDSFLGYMTGVLPLIDAGGDGFIA